MQKGSVGPASAFCSLTHAKCLRFGNYWAESPIEHMDSRFSTLWPLAANDDAKEQPLLSRTLRQCYGRRDHLHIVTFADKVPLAPTLPFARTAFAHGYTVRTLHIKNESTALASKPLLLQRHLDGQCPEAIVMVVDAYDTFVAQPSDIALSRFLATKARVCFAAEPNFSDQPLADRRFWEMAATQAVGDDEHHRYLNTGGIIGYAADLAELVRAAVDAAPIRDELCGQPVRRRCSDQWLFSFILARNLSRFGVVLDYQSRLFYTASGPDWSLAAAKRRIRWAKPVIVHMPWSSSRGHQSLAPPQITNTWAALVADVVDGQPWPESNATMCTGEAHRCARAKTVLSHLLVGLERLAVPAALAEAQTASDDPIVCVPFRACDPRLVSAQHGAQHGLEGTPKGTPTSRYPADGEDGHILCHPLTTWSANPCSHGMQMAHPKIGKAAAPCTSDEPGTLYELCARNTSSAFWSALALAQRSKALVSAVARGASASASAKDRAPSASLSPIRERARRDFLEGERLVLGCAGTGESHFRDVCRAFWASLPPCNTHGKLRLWCR